MLQDQTHVTMLPVDSGLCVTQENANVCLDIT